MNGITRAMVRVEGTSPLLMHNGMMASPMNEWTKKIKEITSKHHTKKTEADEIEIMRLEWNGGLYYDENVGPYIPDSVIEGNIRDAAKSNRKGQAVVAGMQVNDFINKLIYKGPRDRENLYKDKRFVDIRPIKLQKSSTIMRTRPRFDNWAVEFFITAIDEIISIQEIKKFIEYGGTFKGYGDYRPKFGRFILKSFDVE